MRPLSPEEAALWARVTATIRPLSRQAPTTAKPEQAQPPPEPPRTPAKAAPAPRKVTPPPRPQPGTTLDGSWDRKLESGSVVPDRVLDLHGHNLD